jgi:lysophospholipase L1-like esterase
MPRHARSSRAPRAVLDPRFRFLTRGPRLRVALLALVLAVPAAPIGDAHAAPRRSIVVIGDSTTFGTPPPGDGGQSPYNPAAALAALLKTLEPAPTRGGTPWRRARVHNLGVGASNTAHWIAAPPAGCGTFLEASRLVKAACAAGVAWLDAIPAAVPGPPPDVYIVHLGLNDLLVTSDPSETVDRLEEIASRLAPTPVLFFPPIGPLDGPRGDWPQRVRAEMELRGLFASPSYPAELPTFDGLHPTHGSYAALAALWLDALRALP